MSASRVTTSSRGCARRRAEPDPRIEDDRRPAADAHGSQVGLGQLGQAVGERGEADDEVAQARASAVSSSASTSVIGASR